MKIREFHPGDERDIIALLKACDLVIPWTNPHQDIARELKVDPDLFLVGLEEETIVASVMGGYEGHRGWINYLAVHPDHRGKGFAESIMSQVEERIKSKGCPKICLQVRASNHEVIKFYESIGYRNDHIIGLGKRLVADEPFQD